MTPKKVKPLLLVVLALSVLFLAACHRATAPPGSPNASDWLDTWHDVATDFSRYPPDDPRPLIYGRIQVRTDLWLVIKKPDYYHTVYFVQKGTIGRMLAGSDNHAEIELVTPDVIQLMSYTSSDGFHYFPDRITYNVEKDERTVDFLYWDCAEPFRFNYDVKVDGHEPDRYVGHEILDVAADSESVTITFSSSSPVPMHPTWDRPPETFTSSDESASVFNLLFVGSTVSREAIEKAGALEPTEACSSFSLDQIPEGAQLSVGLKKPMEYRAGSMEYSSPVRWDLTDGGLSTTIWLRAK